MDLENLPDSTLVKIMDDYFDFELKKEKGIRDIKDWMSKRIEEVKLELYTQLGFSTGTPKDFLVYFGDTFYVKRHPLLEIRFYEEGTTMARKAYIPDNFTGLNIHAAHSGSEGIVDMLNFKPEMNAYLRSIGIDYVDRSVTEL